jgi:small subunit ribosomal protein S18
MNQKKQYYKKRNCQFTEEGVVPDYKDITRLKKLISDRGKIMPKARTGTSSKYQRAVSKAVKRARHLALLPFVSRG